MRIIHNRLKVLICCRYVVEMIFGGQGNEKEMIKWSQLHIMNVIKMPVTCSYGLLTACQKVFIVEERVKITLNE